MKDVPGWKAGENVYLTGRWVEPLPDQLKFPEGEYVY